MDFVITIITPTNLRSRLIQVTPDRHYKKLIKVIESEDTPEQSKFQGVKVRNKATIPYASHSYDETFEWKTEERCINAAVIYLRYAYSHHTPQ